MAGGPRRAAGHVRHGPYLPCRLVARRRSGGSRRLEHGPAPVGEHLRGDLRHVPRTVRGHPGPRLADDSGRFRADQCGGRDRAGAARSHRHAGRAGHRLARRGGRSGGHRRRAHRRHRLRGPERHPHRVVRPGLLVTRGRDRIGPGR